MNFYKIFHKSKIIFLFLNLVCIIPYFSAKIYAGEVEIEGQGLSPQGNSLWVAYPSNNYILKTKSIQDSILFILGPQKNPDKDIKYSFKIEHIRHNLQSGHPGTQWSEWSDINYHKYYLPPGNYQVLVKMKSGEQPEQFLGNYNISVIKESQSLMKEIIIVLIVFTFLGGFVLFLIRDRKQRSTEIQVAGIKPIKPAEEKKDTSHYQKYKMVTVLFADIEGFSEITDSMEPEKLLAELNSFFFFFDTIVDKYHLEKIKTMGDAYMCAGGVPVCNHTNPIDVTLAAFEVQDHFRKLKEKNPNVWSIRIGIHTGPVIGGFLGHKKLSFDIWGHTVNMASRMESSCKSGHVGISGATYEHARRFFDCEYQGQLLGRAGEENAIYTVKGLKYEFTGNHTHDFFPPNQQFHTEMQLLRLNDLEQDIRSRLENNTDKLYFHNINHIHDVCEQVELLGHSEGISDDEMLLVKTAALLHDVGYAEAYENARSKSKQIALELLSQYYYSQEQIEVIYSLIDATHYDHTPQNTLEQIMHDANLMYYGRVDFVASMIALFKEQKEHQVHNIPEVDWFKMQLDHLLNHCFYTRAASKFVTVSVQEQVVETEKIISKHII